MCIRDRFEGNVEARPIEPGVPVLVVGVDETAEHAQEMNHHEYQRQFIGKGRDEEGHEHE